MFDQFLGEESRRVGKWMTISLVVLSAFLLVKVISDIKRLPSAGREVYPQSTISVNGEGEAFAIPDVASFSFTITETGEDVASAQRLLDTKISSALAVVKEVGVEDRDVKTISYNVYPKYEWEQAICPVPLPSVGGTSYCGSGRNKLIGYEVSQTISVKVRDTEKAGNLVTKVGGINVSNISGLEFTVDDREKYVAEAREQAISKAKEQAKVLADQLGVRLGKVLYYTDNGAYPLPYYAEGMGGGDMRVSAVAPTKAELPTGESRIVSNVTITYELK